MARSLPVLAPAQLQANNSLVCTPETLLKQKPVIKVPTKEGVEYLGDQVGPVQSEKKCYRCRAMPTIHKSDPKHMLSLQKTNNAHGLQHVSLTKTL